MIWIYYEKYVLIWLIIKEIFLMHRWNAGGGYNENGRSKKIERYNL
jgi:hypothetical protein